MSIKKRVLLRSMDRTTYQPVVGALCVMSSDNLYFSLKRHIISVLSLSGDYVDKRGHTDSPAVYPNEPLFQTKMIVVR